MRIVSAAEATGMATKARKPVPGDSLTLELDKPTRLKVERIAESRNVTSADVVREAVSAYLDYDSWASAEIEAGMREADAGDFASDEEVKAAFRRLRS
jgi:predicted transcriptional regulator